MIWHEMVKTSSLKNINLNIASSLQKYKFKNQIFVGGKMITIYLSIDKKGGYENPSISSSKSWWIWTPYSI